MTSRLPLGEDDLQAYVDGRLAPSRRAEVEAYLQSDAAAAARIADQIADRAALREMLAFKAAEPLPSRLRIANLRSVRRASMARAFVAAAAACLCLFVGGAAGWFMRDAQATRVATARADAGVADDAIRAYRTFASEVVHPVEVGADREAHLVQWLSRRLGKSLKAPDLSGQGFRLIGGRLLPASDMPAAQFMYEDAQGRRATVYVRPGGTNETSSFRFERKGEIAAFSWMDRDLSFAVVAETTREKLSDVAHAIYDQFDPS